MWGGNEYTIIEKLGSLVVENSDVEDTISRDKAVIRTMAGKLKNSIVGIRNAHSRRSMSSSERNQHTKKVSPDGYSEARTEDWGGPSFSLFQNESQDILADVTVRVESGAIISLDEESDIRVVTWNMDNETSKEIKVCRTEGMQCSDDMDDENNKNNTKNEEQNRMIEEQRKQIEELQAVVSQLNVEIEAQSLIMRNFQNQMIDVEKLERTTKDDRAFCMKEMSVLPKENMDLTTALADAMAKIEIHEQRDIRKEEYATKMQDALDSIQSKLQVKKKEHRDACNALLEKSRLITAFQSRAGALEKQVFAKQNEIEELKLRLVEKSNRIESFVRTVDARAKVISEQSERIEEMQRVIQNYDDVAISNQVHQITQLYAPVDEEEQNDIQRSSVADRVKERVIERKRVNDEHFEYADYKKLKASAVDLSKDDNKIRVRRKVRM